MSKIIITETDLTSNVASQDITDIVFIPGFGATTGDDIAKEFVPTLCRTVDEFNTYFGSTPQYFLTAQNYPAQNQTSGSEADGFLPNAVPTPASGEQSTVWFKINDPDPSYIMAKELLLAGIPVLYERINGTDSNNVQYGVNVADAYKALKNIVFKYTDGEADGDSVLCQKDYQVKYITSGGFPTSEYAVWGGSTWSNSLISSNMASIACFRGDAVAIIDHTDKPERAFTGSSSAYYFVSESGSRLAATADLDTYAAMFTPWGTYSLSGTYGTIKELNFGGSFAYLRSLAKSLKTNPNWYAVAGASRGVVPGLVGLHTDSLLTNAIANKFQPDAATTAGTNAVCINAITEIKPYGLCIWGNRTLRNQTVGRDGFAIGFLNLRNLICDVKKQAHLAALSLMFEQNNDALWVNFKSMLTPLLDQMVSGNGISGYKIIKNTSNSKTKLNASIKIYPIYAVEEFEIGIQITDEEVSVE